MLRKWNRFLAVLLAFALVVTTFGSDWASVKAYADGTESNEDAGNGGDDEGGLRGVSFAEPADTPTDPPSNPPASEDEDDDNDGGPKEGVPTEPEEGDGGPDDEVEPVYDEEGNLISGSKVAEAGSEDLTDALRALGSEPEDGESDGNKITINYAATTGGHVSPESEEITIVEGVTPEATGSTAYVDDEDYTFVGWSDGETIICDDPNFTPAGDQIVDGATYTATFKQEVYTVKYMVDDSVYMTQSYNKNSNSLSLPQDPFKAGYFFNGWKIGDEKVEDGYTVNENLTITADLEEIRIFEVTIRYYYENPSTPGEEVEIGKTTVEVEKNDLPKVVISPATTQVELGEDDATYYPEMTSVTISSADIEDFIPTEENTRKDGAVTIGILDRIDVKYIPFNVYYNIAYMLQNLNGNGYTEVERDENVKGIKGTRVTPEIKNITGGVFESEDTDVELTEDSSQTLHVYYTRKTYTLQFNAMGGNYVEAITDKYGTTIRLNNNPLLTPEYKGHTFKGWYTDEACTIKAADNYVLEGDAMLYAKWEAGKAGYTLVYETENANDTGYSYAGSVIVKATDRDAKTIGTTYTADKNSVKPADWDADNFTFESSTSAVIEADDSTIITVRYKRNVYTIQANNNANRKVTAKYGADIYSQYKATFVTQSEGGAWAIGYNCNECKVVAVETMPSPKELANKCAHGKNKSISGNTIYAYYFAPSTTSKQTLNYWLENYESSLGTKTKDGKTYGLYRSETSQFVYVYYKTDFYEIAGYEKASYDATNQGWEDDGYNSWMGWVENWKYYSQTHSVTSEFGNWKNDNSKKISYYENLTLNMYYNAYQYQLSFVDYDGTQLSTQMVSVGTDISGYLTTNQTASETKMHAEIADAQFNVWTTDAAHHAAYTPGTDEKYRMRAGGLQLYADYTFPTRTFTFVDPFTGTDVVVDSTDVRHGGTVESITPSYEHEGHYFGGWYTSKDYSKKFDFLLPIVKDITVYAKWNQKQISYTVKYVDEDGNNVANPKTVTNIQFKPGQVVTEEALAVIGMYPDKTSQELTLGFGENLLTFVYKERPEKIFYTVKYVYMDGDKEVAVAPPAVDKEVNGSTAAVAEAPVEPDYSYIEAGYEGMKFYPVEKLINHTFTYTDEDNVIVFHYLPYASGSVTVNYVDMDGNSLADIVPSVTEYLKVGDTYTVNANIDGFVKGRIEDEQQNVVGSKVIVTEGETIRTVFLRTKVKVTAKDKTQEYTGEPLKSNGVGDAEVDGLKEGHSLTSIEYDGEQLYAGSSPTTPKNAKFEGPRAEDYYYVEYTEGTLTVTQIAITAIVTFDQISKVYDGTEHTASYKIEYSLEGFEDVADQYVNITGNAPLKATDVTEGKQYLDVHFSVKPEYADTFKITFNVPTEQDKLGYLEITRRPLYVTTASWTTMYPEPCTKDEGEITGFVDGEGYESFHCNGVRNEVIEYVDGVATEFNENTIDESSIVYNNNTKGSNYYIDWHDSRTHLGELRVTPREITVNVTGHVSDPDPITYDAEEHTVEGYDAEVDSADKAKLDELGIEYKVSGDDADFVGPTQDTYSVTETAVGEYPLNIKKADFDDANQNSNFTVNVNVQDGHLNIVKPETVVIKVTGKTQSKVYNGSEQYTDGDGYEIEIQKDESGKYSLDKVQMIAKDAAVAKGTTVGNYAMGLDDEDADGTYKNFKNTDSNFNVQFLITDGELEITKAKIEVTATGNTDTVYYNGVEQSVPGYELKVEQIVDNERKDATSFYTAFTKPDQKDIYAKGIDVDTYAMNLSKDDFVNTDDTNYDVDFIVTNGWLQIDKLPITVYIKGNSDTKTYTGQPQSVNGYTVDKYKAKDKDGNESETTLYKREYFDGPEQDADVVTATGTAADTYTMTVTRDNFFVKNTEEANANFDVSFDVTPGTLTITPAGEITVTVIGNNNEDAHKTYNGQEQSVTGFKVAEGTDESIKVTAKNPDQIIAKGTDAGTYYMELEPSYFTATSDNYEKINIKVVAGYLIIDPSSDRDVPKFDGYNGVYDGKDHDVHIVSGHIDGDEYTYSYLGADGQVVESTTAPTAKNVADSIQGNVSITVTNKNYETVYPAPVALNITKRPVAVQTASDTKKYDGTPLTKTDDAFVVAVPNVSDSGLVGNETATVVASGSQTEVGGDEHNNTYKVTDITWVSADDNNYEVVEAEDLLGTLTVTANTIAITLTAPDDSRDYNGEAFVVNPDKQVGVEITGEGANDIKGRFKFKAVTVISQKEDSEVAFENGFVNAGSAYNYIKSYQIINKETEADVTEYFDPQYITTVSGNLTINKAKLYIKTETDSKPYDGEPLVAGASAYATYNGNTTETQTLTVEADYNAETGDFSKTIVLIGNDNVPLKIKGTITEVGGPIDNTYVFDWANGTALEGNYEVVPTVGTLTIANSDAEIIITVTGDEKTYDGEKHWATIDYTATGDYTVENLKVSETSFAINVEDGKVPANVGTFVIKNKNGKDVTSQLVEQGAVTIIDYDHVEDADKKPVIVITKKDLTVKTETASRAFNGLPLTAGGSIDGFVDGEDAPFEVTGTITYPDEGENGTVKNTYEVKWDDESATALESNYNVVEEVGTLTITDNEAEIVVEALSDHKTYDGTPLTADGITEESSSKLPSDEFKIVPVVKGEVTHVAQGKVKNVVDSFQIMQGEKDVTEFFSKATSKDGELYIEPATLKIYTPTATKKYDGTPLTAEGSIDGFVTVDGAKETATFKTTGTVTYPKEGEKENSYSLDWNGTAAETDYTLDKDLGTLTVTNRPDGEKFEIIATPVSEDRMYNGKEQTDFSYVISFGEIYDEDPEYIEDLQEQPTILQRAVQMFRNAGEAVADFFEDLFTVNADAKEVGPETYSDDLRSFTATADAEVIAVDGEGTIGAKNVGTYALIMDEDTLENLTVIDGKGEDVSDQFKLVPGEDGELNIKPISATVTANSYSRTTAQSDPTFDAVVSLPEEYQELDNYAELLAEAKATPYEVTCDHTNAVGTYAITPNPTGDYTAVGDRVYAQGNFEVTYVPGTLTITAAPSGGGDTPSDPTPIPDAPTPTAAAPAGVLGARRDDALTDGAAVLGARRGRTEDEANTNARVFAIVMAVAAAITALIAGKKKEEEED